MSKDKKAEPKLRESLYSAALEDLQNLIDDVDDDPGAEVDSSDIHRLAEKLRGVHSLLMAIKQDLF